MNGPIKHGRDLKPFCNEEEEGPTDYNQFFQLDEANNEWCPIGKRLGKEQQERAEKEER